MADELLDAHRQWTRTIEARGGWDYETLRAVNPQLLAARGINEVQVEAGATLAGAFLHAELADEVLLYIAPVVLGSHARPLFGGMDVGTMAERLQLQVVDTRRIGADLRVLLRPEPAA